MTSYIRFRDLYHLHIFLSVRPVFMDAITLYIEYIILCVRWCRYCINYGYNIIILLLCVPQEK